jgi:DDE superfamily endonuclease
VKHPDYAGKPQPAWSNGWLAGFKSRHGIYRIENFGELGSVPVLAAVEMNDVRLVCMEYTERNIFNMDETGLFWRRSVSMGLATKSQPGKKRDKTRISLVLCSNANGSERHPLWLIGKAKTPHALRGVNIAAHGIVWQHNTKAWMNEQVMIAWLQSFYDHVKHTYNSDNSTRSVVLLLDNFSAHIKAVTNCPPPSNIKILFLPKNSTSIYQPLDQGIINTFKTAYRREWLRYCITCYQTDQDPVKSVTIFDALKWCGNIWRTKRVTDNTVLHCFQKSTVIPRPPLKPPVEPPIERDIVTLYLKAFATAHIQDAMSIESFLNPEGENDDGGEDTSIDTLIEADLDAREEFEQDAQQQPRAVPPDPIEAHIAIVTLLRFLEVQDTMTESDMRVLQRLDRQIYGMAASSAKQTEITEYFKK